MLNLDNKEIFEMKLTVTNRCVLRCNYCFVDKDRGVSEMNYTTAKKAIDFFLSTKGRTKILKIYGGEPLLNFAIVKRVTSYAQKQAKRRGINLTLSLCTNAVLLKPQHIDFFKKNEFQLAISFDGSKKTHDKFRKFPNGRGTFELIKKNISHLFKKLDKKDMAANMAVVPSEASNMFENFQQILKAGFDTLNLEPIYGFQQWTSQRQKYFQDGVKSIIDFMIEEISKGNFIFLTTVNRELKYKTLSKLKNGVCLFHQFPEIYPDGEIAFSSFFLNFPRDRQGKYIIGNVRKGKLKRRFENCRFVNESKKCRECLGYYFDVCDESLSSTVVQLRNLFSIKLADLIIKKSKTRQNFKKYISEAKKHICF